MVDAKAAAAQYYNFMDAAQKNEYNEIVKQIGASQDQITLINQKKVAAQNFSKSLAQVASKTGETTQNQLGIAIEYAEDLREQLESLKGINGTRDLGNYDTFANLVNSVSELQTVVGDNAVPAFKQFYDIMSQIANPADASEQQLKQLKNAAQSVFNQVYQRADLVQRIDEIRDSAKQAQAEFQLVQQARYKFLSGVKQFADIKSFINLISGLGQIASGFNNIINLTKVWRNESISTGQKILQTFTNLTMTLPMLINGFSQTIGNSKKLWEEIQRITLARTVDTKT